ncbi:MAG: type II toxin-antitoxin system HicB family antitoxin [Ignavibacteriae bacterium]|nr:type II toxin-antitoxin system HicB family antitoxin [Ignavibacteriota bacterium]
MLKLKYNLVIEATDDPNFFGFYSPDLEGFSGVGNSIEDCIYKATWGMEEQILLLRQQSLNVPPPSPHPTITIENEKDAKQVASTNEN